MYDAHSYSTLPSAVETAALLREIAAGLLTPEIAKAILATIGTSPAPPSRANAQAISAGCAAGHAVAFAMRLGWTPPAETTTRVAETPHAAPPSEPRPAPPVESVDDFTLICGIDPEAARLLAGLRLTHFRDIAAFTPEDVAIIGETLDDPRRVSRQGWIEQAALLARGQDTLFARRERARRRDAEAAAARKNRAPSDVAEEAKVAASFPLVELSLADTIVISPLETDMPLGTGTDVDAPATEPGETLHTEIAAPTAPSPKPATTKRSPRGGVTWMAIAASVLMLVAAAASSFAVSPAFALYLEGLRCTHSFIGRVAVCERLSWLGE